jgi:ABC-type lipoprotein export system ATPase subunit
MSGLDKPTHGKVLIENENIENLSNQVLSSACKETFN